MHERWFAKSFVTPDWEIEKISFPKNIFDGKVLSYMWFESSCFLQKDIFHSLCILLSERYLLLTKNISIKILKLRGCAFFPSPLISVTMFPGIWAMNFLAWILRMPKVSVSSLGKKGRCSAWCFENSLVFWCQPKMKKFSKSKCYNFAICLQTSLRHKSGYYEECSWTTLFVHNFNCCKSL